MQDARERTLYVAVEPQFYSTENELATLAAAMFNKDIPDKKVRDGWPNRVNIFCHRYEDAGTILRTFTFAKGVQLFEEKNWRDGAEWFGVDDDGVEWKFRWATPTMGYARGLKGEYAIVKVSMETHNEFMNSVQANHYREVGVV